MIHSTKNKVLRIDGSHGEGGGQILRTSLALSCVHGQPIEILNIRSARKKPGLQPQHLTAVKAAAEISHAHVEGNSLGSAAIRFSPVATRGGDYFFDVSETKGSAGSTSLVLQTILLPLCFADRPSNVVMQGGTHVPWSPTFHYLKNAYLPMLSHMGVNADVRIEKWGWYPEGGGKVALSIRPGNELLPVTLTERGKLVKVTGVSAVANLLRDIAVRQRNRAAQMLLQKGIDAEIEIVSAPSPGKGTLLFLLAEFVNVSAGFDALGAIGKRAEEVADEASLALYEHIESDAALDPHLADQIIPYLALAEGTSEFTTSRITRHLLTNIWVVEQFMDVSISVQGNEGEIGRITVKSNKLSLENQRLSGEV